MGNANLHTIPWGRHQHVCVAPAWMPSNLTARILCGAGATIQVLLFAVLAVEIKRKAPTTHTCLEIVKARWGTTAHMVFLVFCLLTNIIVTSMLILGGASVVTALTGVNIYAGAFLIPVGVMLYTAHGGLKATFIAAWGKSRPDSQAGCCTIECGMPLATLPLCFKLNTALHGFRPGQRARLATACAWGHWLAAHMSLCRQCAVDVLSIGVCAAPSTCKAHHPLCTMNIASKPITHHA